MSLGSQFPPGFRRAQVERQLQPGVVIKLLSRMDDGRMHEKRFLVLAVSEITVTCVINSRISAFISHRAELLKCQVAMPKRDHDFMDHDSNVDCSRTHTFATKDVIRNLAERPEWVLGQISSELRDLLAAALKFAPTLAPAEVAGLIQSIEGSDLR